MKNSNNKLLKDIKKLIRKYEKVKKKYLSRQRLWQLQMKEQGLCMRCGKEKDRYDRNLCQNCRNIMNEKSKIYRNKVKEK